jgi:peptidoglycan/xylan/chitin deacetylase (PgdA/CDA1 family)
MTTLTLIFILLLLGTAAYTLVPELFLHYWGIGSWKRHYTAGVALTFDDGPDPVITPRILACLARHQVQAAFFLIGSKAVQYPELVQEILAQGHQIGLHSQNHRNAWFQSPWATWREWDTVSAALENIAGRQIDWVRPPWGAFNLVIWWWTKKHHKQIVLWNIEGHDWQVKQSAAEIARRILRKARNGSIVLLHDSGGEKGAPEQTLQALDDICQGLTAEKKLPVVALEFPYWSSLRRVIFNFWQRWEQLFAWVKHLEVIDDTNIFRLVKTRYKGSALISQEGQIIAQEGDIVAEMHIDSLRVIGKGADIQTVAVRALRQARDSLPGLAAYVRNNPKYKDIQVLVGLTLLNRGVKGLGFNVQDVPSTLFYRGIGFLQKINLRIYHPAKKVTRQKQLEGRSKIVWISKEELLGRWLRET